MTRLRTIALVAAIAVLALLWLVDAPRWVLWVAQGENRRSAATSQWMARAAELLPAFKESPVMRETDSVTAWFTLPNGVQVDLLDSAGACCPPVSDKQEVVRLNDGIELRVLRAEKLTVITAYLDHAPSEGKHLSVSALINPALETTTVIELGEALDRFVRGMDAPSK